MNTEQKEVTIQKPKYNRRILIGGLAVLILSTYFAVESIGHLGDLKLIAVFGPKVILDPGTSKSREVFGIELAYENSCKDPQQKNREFRVETLTTEGNQEKAYEIIPCSFIRGENPL